MRAWDGMSEYEKMIAQAECMECRASGLLKYAAKLRDKASNLPLSEAIKKKHKTLDIFDINCN